MVPGSAIGVPVNGVDTVVDVGAADAPIQLMSAAVPAGPFVSITSFSVWVPAGSATPVLVTVFQVFQPPVSGSVIDPLTFAPSISMCADPPAPAEAMRRSTLYVPPEAIDTTYASHSVARTALRL